MSTVDEPLTRDWYALTADDAVAALRTDAGRGLSVDEAAARLAQYGPNELTSEPPPAVWKIAFEQLRARGGLTMSRAGGNRLALLLSMAMFVLGVAGLLGYVTSSQMARLPDPEPNDAAAAVVG